MFTIRIDLLIKKIIQKKTKKKENNTFSPNSYFILPISALVFPDK